MSTRSIHINGTTNRESELSIDSITSAPQGYEKGDFDGHAVQVTITDGRLTIQPGSGAVNAKICFVEIGAQGTTIDQATKDRSAALIEQATTQTAATVQSTTAKRQYVFGSYVDELVSYTVGSSRYFVHSNHLYSPSAVTNAAGQVQERYRYDAYGKQTVTTATGTTRNQSAVGFSRGFTGFTGYILDEETGLYYTRARMYSPGLGRFVSRDPKAYIDGENLYGSYYIPNENDPNGLEKIKICKNGFKNAVEKELFKSLEITMSLSSVEFNPKPGACGSEEFAYKLFIELEYDKLKQGDQDWAEPRSVWIIALWKDNLGNNQHFKKKITKYRMKMTGTFTWLCAPCCKNGDPEPTGEPNKKTAPANHVGSPHQGDPADPQVQAANDAVEKAIKYFLVKANIRVTPMSDIVTAFGTGVQGSD